MASNEPSPDVPLFLRKTYHMIDTCDPAIASWTEDGETFVVKDPVLFEQTIIPQFFKHSKFSSFVRQLNFYSFRKVKYHDTLRIDPKLEAETANYWRFKHDSFQRGKPQLLSNIRRMQSVPTGTTGKSSATDSKGSPSATLSNSSAPQPDGVVSSVMSSEVQTLKKRIEEMTKNIDELTAMVKVVSLKQEGSSTSSTTNPPPQQQPRTFTDAYYYPSRAEGSAGAKRKKWSDSPTIGAWSDEEEIVRPDEIVSSMDLDEIVASPVASMPMAEPLERESSIASTQVSDMEFVDSLFTAFKDDQGDEVFVLNEGSDDLAPQQQMLPNTTSTEANALDNKNRPDEELMRRLSDALMLLPKEMQEMIVNRLIAAITSTDFVSCASGGCKSMVGNNKVELEGPDVPVVPLPQTVEEDHQAPFPLAAATLAALLHHYTSQMQHGKSSTANKSGTVEKSIPVIPVHA